MSKTSRRWPLICALLAVSVLGAACGDDDDTETGSATTVAGSDSAAYCEKSLAIETVEEPDIDFESLSEEAQKAAVREFVGGSFQKLAKEAQAVTPVAIKADVDTLVGAVNKVAETGDFSVFDSDPMVKAAEERVHVYDLANCGWAKQNVTAADYSFSGVANPAQPGPTSFDFTNGGTEVHELSIVKKKDGVTESFDEILELSEEEGQKKVDFVGGVDPTKPGDTDYAVVNLEKGEYLLVCFLPVGATPELFAKVEAGTAQPPEGPPHFTRGMRVTLTVA